MDQEQALLDYLLSIGALQPQQDEMVQQQLLVQQLREGAQMPGMRQAGRVSVAANPLEALNAGLSGALAGQGQRKLGDMQKAYGQQRRDLLGGYLAKQRAPKTPGIDSPEFPAAPVDQGAGPWSY